METQGDTIFITGLPREASAREIESHFKIVGNIKFDKGKREPKIWIYTDKETGEGKGEATVTFDDESFARAAIDWFNEKPFLNTNNILKITFSQRKAWTGRDNGRGGRDHGGGESGSGRGRGGFPMKEGDWRCEDCGNINFSKRFKCNRCEKPRSGGDEPHDGGRGRGGYGRNDAGGADIGGYDTRSGGPSARGNYRGGDYRRNDNSHQRYNNDSDYPRGNYESNRGDRYGGRGGGQYGHFAPRERHMEEHGLERDRDRSRRKDEDYNNYRGSRSNVGSGNTYSGNH